MVCNRGEELINDTAAYHQGQSRSRSPSLAKLHIYFSDLCSNSPSCFRAGLAAGPRFGSLRPRSCHIHLLHALSHRCTPVVDSPTQSEHASQHQSSGHRGSRPSVQRCTFGSAVVKPKCARLCRLHVMGGQPESRLCADEATAEV